MTVGQDDPAWGPTEVGPLQVYKEVVLIHGKLTRIDEHERRLGAADKRLDRHETWLRKHDTILDRMAGARGLLQWVVGALGGSALVVLFQHWH